MRFFTDLRAPDQFSCFCECERKVDTIILPRIRLVGCGSYFIRSFNLQGTSKIILLSSGIEIECLILHTRRRISIFGAETDWSLVVSQQRKTDLGSELPAIIPIQKKVV